MFIVLILAYGRWRQFEEPVATYVEAEKLTRGTSLPWLITIVVARDAGVVI